MEHSPFPNNKSFTRWWTIRELRRAREQHGDEHPDTVAAHAAAVAAWGEGRVPPLAIQGREIGKTDRRVEGDRPAFSDGRRVSDKLAALMARVGAKPADGDAS